MAEINLHDLGLKYLSDKVSKNHTHKGFFDFLSKYTNEEVSHSITRFIPSKVDTRISKILKIRENEAIIKREEFYYGIFDKLICCSEITFHPELVDLIIVRKLN